MNELNYASQEASQRLVDAGIVLETDVYWYHYPESLLLEFKHYGKEIPSDYLVTKASTSKGSRNYIPAPSMAEVWRELPQEFKGGDFEVGKTIDGLCFAGYYIAADYLDDFGTEVITFKNINPTDALIDLLIWVTEQKRKEKV